MIVTGEVGMKQTWCSDEGRDSVVTCNGKGGSGRETRQASERVVV